MVNPLIFCFLTFVSTTLLSLVFVWLLFVISNSLSFLSTCSSNGGVDENLWTYYWRVINWFVVCRDREHLANLVIHHDTDLVNRYHDVNIVNACLVAGGIFWVCTSPYIAYYFSSPITIVELIVLVLQLLVNGC